MDNSMKKIITLTVNPAIDKSTTVNGIKPNSKLRCAAPAFEPGGGGINVSRVIGELGGTSLCTYLAGGPTGVRLKEMLSAANILQQIIPIQGWTRENLAVTDVSNNQQFRFGMPGPEVLEEEWKITLIHLEAILPDGDFLVASGSLSPGMPVDFFAKVARIAKSKQVKFILDTSGEPLSKGLEEGVFLLKPNLGELSNLCGVRSISYSELETLAYNFLKNNPCDIMVVSLGPQGALLVTREASEYIQAPVVHQKSTIGAGDSMVAGMVVAMARGASVSEMARFGVACGTAATMTPGTQLCKKEDAEHLNNWIASQATQSAKSRINTLNNNVNL